MIITGRNQSITSWTARLPRAQGWGMQGQKSWPQHSGRHILFREMATGLRMWSTQETYNTFLINDKCSEVLNECESHRIYLAHTESQSGGLEPIIMIPYTRGTRTSPFIECLLCAWRYTWASTHFSPLKTHGSPWACCNYLHVYWREKRFVWLEHLSEHWREIQDRVTFAVERLWA